MSDLTEVEIFDCVKTHLRAAAEHCLDLARKPLQGPSYVKLREELKLVEGACRQAGHWREDSRWFAIGLQMEEAHRRCGFWLRGKHPRPLFAKLAEALVDAYNLVELLRTAKTGRRGMILPDSMTASAPRNTSFAGWETQIRPSGLIVPATVQ